MAKYDGKVDNHATSNTAISDKKKGKKEIKTASLSLKNNTSLVQLTKLQHTSVE